LAPGLNGEDTGSERNTREKDSDKPKPRTWFG